MRIVIDMQGAQTESRFRGIGRYTMSFAQSVVRNRGEHEIVLVLSGLFPDTIKPIRAAFQGLLPQENIRVWHAPAPVAAAQQQNHARRQFAELIREAFLASLQADLIHVCSLFEGYVDDAVTSIRHFDQRTPVSVTLYDLIPLLNPDQYLAPHPSYERYYRRKIEHLKQATSYLAISEFARQEAVQYLALDSSAVTNISTAVNESFRPLSLSEHTRTEIQQKLHLSRPFVLYTGGADQRKNLPRLIQAYASLPVRLRQSHQMLFAGKMPDCDVAHFKQVAKSAGLKADELLFTGFVSDEVLVQLYSLCTLYVFPSWHEGFGLPALEAMACGAPVIGANTSSLPEVIGLNEALFDPMQVSAIAAKLDEALSNAGFQNQLKENGLQRAKLFSWDETARRAIACWELLAQDTEDSFDSWAAASSATRKQYTEVVRSVAQQVGTLDVLAESELINLAFCLEKNEKELLSFHRRKPLPEQLSWRMEGPFDSSYSLALVNREFSKAINALGHNIAMHSTDGPGDFPANKHFLDENPLLAQMYEKSKYISPVESNITSRNLYPPRVHDLESQYNIMHNYAWEETGFPAQWTENLNQYLQGLAVVSHHVKKILIDNGVTVPIAVTSNGIDHWNRITADRSFSIKAKSFRFLHVSSCFPRKGADKMLEAYGNTFSKDDDVSLVIKTFSNPHNEIHRWIEDAKSANPDYPDVQVIDGDFSDAALKSLYEQCHALVAPSRAEGFGLPMAEAILSGLAVITTNWSGQTDFCTPDTAWLVDYHFARATSHFGIYSSVWAEPDSKDLAKKMREVYSLTEEGRAKKVDAGRALLNEKFKWSDCATKTIDFIRSMQTDRSNSTPNIGWISSWGTHCGIASYSQYLIKNMFTDIKILASKTNEPDQENIFRCWTAGDDDPLLELENKIKELNINTLIIQFNYGFFNLDKLNDFINSQADKGISIVVMLHATNDPVHAPDKKLSKVIPALKRCDRLLVHSPNDLNRLKNQGAIDNIAIFPHGVLDYDKSIKSSESKGFTIASYGFFLPHKGLHELIEAIAILRKQGMSVELKMINSEYPVSQSRELIEGAKALIKKLGLSDYIELNTNYLEDSESLEYLASADLVVYPYQVTGESSSAAVRNGLAAQCPVAVTPLDIFEDVSEVVHHLPGMGVENIADGIKDILYSLKEKSTSAVKIEKAAETWRQQHLYSAMGKRLNNLVCSLHSDKQGRVLGQQTE